MDIDSLFDEILDPISKIFKEISVPDPFSLLDAPAKSLRVRYNYNFELEQRKRVIALVLLDVGTHSKYYFILIVLLTRII